MLQLNLLCLLSSSDTDFGGVAAAAALPLLLHLLLFCTHQTWPAAQGSAQNQCLMLHLEQSWRYSVHLT
jgi:hypothetical protein